MSSVTKRILDKVGSSQELAYYLNLYRTINPERFAVVKISGECLQTSLEQIAEDLADLQQLGLIPIVTHGWGKELTQILESEGIQTHKVNEDRYTDERVMKYVLSIANKKATELASAISNAGGKAFPFLPLKVRVLTAVDKQGEEYGSNNGEITKVDLDLIFEVIKTSIIPIISPIGISEDGAKMYNINAADAGSQLVKAVDPVKYLMITQSGGVIDKRKVIDELIIRRDYERLVREGVISGGMRKNVDEAITSLTSRYNGDDKSVQIVGPGNLLHELFTKKGAGTFVRMGYEIEKIPLKDANHEEAREIINRSFAPDELREDYFNNQFVNGALVYREKNGKGVAIQSGPYIDILAVPNGGNGVGTDVLYELKRRTPKLAWRSKISRLATNEFYFKMSDGHQRVTGPNNEQYNVFWIGFTPDEATKHVQYLQNKPSNFK